MIYGLSISKKEMQETLMLLNSSEDCHLFLKEKVITKDAHHGQLSK